LLISFNWSQIERLPPSKLWVEIAHGADMTADYCVFEYMYRDAGNWKSFGSMLLIGDANASRETLRKCLDWADLFVAEQVGIPSLYEAHLASCGSGPSDLDHAYHEFIELRVATEVDFYALKVSGSLGDLVDRMKLAAGHWDVTLSPNCWL
jgi:hypothetical protein